MLIQQGDVVIQAIDSLPAGATAVPIADRIILAEGEATGHSHTVEEQEGARLYTLGEILYLVCDRDVTVVHQEHGPVTVPPGTHKVSRAREWNYTQHEDRAVRD